MSDLMSDLVSDLVSEQIFIFFQIFQNFAFSHILTIFYDSFMGF